VNGKLLRLFAVAMVSTGLAVGVAACGSSDDDNGGASDSSSGGAAATATATASPAAAGKKIRVAMVTDIGGLNDRSFNQLAYQGLKDAKSQLGADIRVLTSSQNSDYVPNLSSLARQKYDLIIGVGFQIAKAYPAQQFAIIDYSQAAMKSKPQNVKGLLFSENQAGYLVGYMAGLYVKDKGGKQVISSVGGQKIPPVDGYIAGYQAGAKAANPQVKTLNAYSQSFTEQDKCKELALNQIQQGSQVVFQVAGGCGLGALDAAKQAKLQGIGVDADQAYLGSYIMTSALKKIDNAVLANAKEIQDGTFKGGSDELFDVKNDGVGFGKVNSVGAKFQADVQAQAKDIADGKVTDIPSTVK
jgi:basic membrane protein A